MVDSDRERLASAVRDLNPEVVVVDDAHADLAGLSSLRQLRTAIGADLRIAAVTWPGDKDEVAEELAVPKSSVLDLRLLTRDEILEVVKAMGIAGPVELQRVIVNQSGGRPGLTATLCDHAIRGEIRSLLSGASLLRDFEALAKGLGDPYLMHVLSLMALAGDMGASLDDVKAILELNVSESQNSIARLGHTGVFRTNSLTGKVEIWPRELRFASVGDSFFSANAHTNLPLGPAMRHLGGGGVAGSLVGAALMGAHVPEQTIEDSLIADGSVDDHKGYARIGSREASFVLRTRPEWLTQIAPHSLLTNPIETVPMLLMQAAGDRRPLNSFTDHPLRILEDWVESAPFSVDEQLERRVLLANATASYANGGGDPQVTVQALCTAMNPKYESSNVDAGSGHTITIKSGLVSGECLNGLVDLWPEVLESIPTEGPEDYSMLLDLLHDWAYCGRSQTATPDDVRQMMRSHAENLASDIASRFSHHPGILSQIREFARRSELAVSISVPEAFGILYPDPDYGAMAKDSDGQHRLWREEACKLAADLEPRGPQEVFAIVGEAVMAAAEAGRGWPNLTGEFADEIARRTDEPYEWAKRAIDAGMESVVVEPLIREARRQDPERCRHLVIRAIKSESTQYAAVRVVLTAEAPLGEEIDAALDALPGIPYMHNLVRDVVHHSAICESTMRLLLRHPSSPVAEITAVSLRLRSSDEPVPESLYNDWRSAVLRSHGVEYMLSSVLKDDSDLLCDWTIAQIERGISDKTRSFIYGQKSFVSGLTFDQKVRILEGMQCKDDFYYPSIVADLVGDDAELFGVLLSLDGLKHHHEAGLANSSDSKIKVAANAGWSPIRIAEAIAHPSGIVIMLEGSESDQWQEWAEYFARLSKSNDPIVSAVGDAGSEWALANYDSARKREDDQDVYGG